MASIRERTTKAGETTFSVLFREHGRQTSETFATRKAAEKFRTLLDVLGDPAKARAEMFGVDRGGLTVGELADRYFAHKAHAGLTPRTVADYRRDYANWIDPHLGHRQADSLDEMDVQALIDHMATRLDAKTVAGHHALLSGMFGWGAAKTRQLVTRNPCGETELPKRKRKPVKGLSLPEYRALYATARANDPDAADFILMLVSTGWRWSEAAALTWREVEDYGDEVYVSVAQVVRRSPGTVMAVVQDAKNATSLRRTRVGPDCAEMLRRRRVGQPIEGRVLTNPNGRPWHQGNFRERHWIPLVKAGGLWSEDRQPTPHWLRHSHVLLMDLVGVSTAQMSRRVGHSNIQTTVNVYGGMIGDVDGPTLEQMDAVLRGAVDPPAVVRGELG